MLSVFITPWQKPTACHCAISRAVRRATSSQQRQQRQRRVAALGIEAVDHAVDQPAQRGHVVGRVREVLEVAEAQEAGRHARHDGRGLDRFAAHRQRRADDGTARAWSGCPGACIASEHRNSRIDERSTARPSPMREYGVSPLPLSWISCGPIGRVDFAEQQRPAVAELAGPDTELVAAVDAGQRRACPAATLPEAPAAHDRCAPVGQAELGGQRVAAGDPVQLGQRLRGQLGPEGRAERLHEALLAPARRSDDRMLQRGIHAAIVGAGGQVRALAIGGFARDLLSRVRQARWG